MAILNLIWPGRAAAKSACKRPAAGGVLGQACAGPRCQGPRRQDGRCRRKGRRDSEASWEAPWLRRFCGRASESSVSLGRVRRQPREGRHAAAHRAREPHRSSAPLSESAHPQPHARRQRSRGTDSPSSTQGRQRGDKANCAPCLQRAPEGQREHSSHMWL